MFDSTDRSLILPAYGPISTARKILRYEAVGLQPIVNTEPTAPNGFQLVALLANQSTVPLAFPIGVLMEEIPVTTLIAAGERRPYYNFTFFGPARVRLAAGTGPVSVGRYVKAWNLGECSVAAPGELSLGRALSNGAAGDLIDIFISPSLALY